MIINKSGSVDTKHNKVPIYNVLIDETEMNHIYRTLFGELDHLEKVSPTIKDGLLNEYIKSYVANEFIKKFPLERSIVYKLSVKSKMVDMDIMISLHDKLDEIFY